MRPSWRSAAARSEREVRARERAFYDAEASARDPDERPPASPDRFEAALLDALGPVDGLRVLELGCGAGDLSLELLRRGALLTAVDVSPGMVELARARAARFRPEAEPRFVVGAAERTGLPDESFDRVVGKWVLHHVDVAAAARETRRLLRPGGRAVFFENQDRNPLLRLARARLWGARRLTWVGTRDEHPLTRADLDTLARSFDSLELDHPSFYCFEALSRALGHRLHRPLRRLDALIWRRLPAARPWSWHVLVVVER
jgi:SAM-dependent methyltransferase